MKPASCRDYAALILAEPDGILSADERAQLAGHLATCAACRDRRAALQEAREKFRARADRVAVPDAAEAWRKLQPLLRAHDSRPRRRLAPLVWFGVPLAAAAAVAFAWLGGRNGVGTPAAPASPSAPAAVETARADYVEAGDAGATTMVYVDKESGWLVVWATDAEAKSRS
jgi:anti-sigma factor RsiW